MLANIMYFGVDTLDPDDQHKVGDITISMSEIAIGIQSGLMVFPINLIIVQLFRLSRPYEKGKDDYDEFDLSVYDDLYGDDLYYELNPELASESVKRTRSQFKKEKSDGPERSQDGATNTPVATTSDADKVRPETDEKKQEQTEKPSTSNAGKMSALRQRAKKRWRLLSKQERKKIRFLNQYLGGNLVDPTDESVLFISPWLRLQFMKFPTVDSSRYKSIFHML